MPTAIVSRDRVLDGRDVGEVWHAAAALARSRTARQIDLSGRVVVFENLKNTGQPGSQALASRLVKRVEAKIFPVRRA